MADDELRREIEALKAQIEALNRSRSEREPGSEGGTPEDNAAAEHESDGGIGVEGLGEDIMSHVHDVLDELGDQLRDANPATLLIVFSLGVLFGRLLPR